MAFVIPLQDLCSRMAEKADRQLLLQNALNRSWIDTCQSHKGTSQLLVD